MAPDFEIQVISQTQVDPETNDFEVLEKCGTINVKNVPEGTTPTARDKAFARAHEKHNWRTTFYRRRWEGGKRIALKARIRIVPVEEEK